MLGFMLIRLTGFLMKHTAQLVNLTMMIISYGLGIGLEGGHR